MKLSKSEVQDFQRVLEQYFVEHGRHDLPWRIPEPDGSFDPYKIMVSEIMLQQTQVPRVIVKYHEFLNRFPTVSALADSSLGEVLTVWQGLGYNRRAKFLWQAAGRVLGEFPDTLEDLVALPGIGPNTAGAILAYAFNRPAIFIETNVRTVYIHHFFNAEVVADKQIQELLEQTLDQASPRLFYWALMDYGSHLKRAVGNKSTQSRHYAKQSPFAGSKRQVRGAVVRMLTIQPRSGGELADAISDIRLPDVLKDLLGEGLIERSSDIYHLA